MVYPVLEKDKYDFTGESYASSFPNLHPYPATMLPQIGIEILRELDISSGRLLDPYCGSGSSFASALACGIKEMDGFDINPLAVLISRAKFYPVDPDILCTALDELQLTLESSGYEPLINIDFKNIGYWFSEGVLSQLSHIKYALEKIDDKRISDFFWVVFSEIIRKVSLTRDNEFKLYRVKNFDEQFLFEPDVRELFLQTLKEKFDVYSEYYYPLLNGTKIQIFEKPFEAKPKYYDVVLTSPPYGDSRTTVAYGQYSFFSNIWRGNENARQIDSLLMGGRRVSSLFENSIITNQLQSIQQASPKRALEVSSFYFDLASSIKAVADSIKQNGYSIYVVGNRTVKETELKTDQFIAEQFERNSFDHLFTFERNLSNKRMPSKNSPSNISGKTGDTMKKEYIIVCRKK